MTMVAPSFRQAANSIPTNDRFAPEIKGLTAVFTIDNQ
jgi:hypothetical protein